MARFIEDEPEYNIAKKIMITIELYSNTDRKGRGIVLRHYINNVEQQPNEQTSTLDRMLIRQELQSLIDSDMLSPTPTKNYNTPLDVLSERMGISIIRRNKLNFGPRLNRQDLMKRVNQFNRDNSSNFNTKSNNQDIMRRFNRNNNNDDNDGNGIGNMFCY